MADPRPILTPEAQQAAQIAQVMPAAAPVAPAPKAATEAPKAVYKAPESVDPSTLPPAMRPCPAGR